MEITMMKKQTKKRRSRDFGLDDDESETENKRLRLRMRSDFFDGLPDDIVISILIKLSSTSTSPSHFINVLSTCKRLNGLALHRLVLAKASPKSLAIKAKNWSDSAHRFLKRCVDSGNVEASYILGMIRFYCLENRGNGASLMAKAAMNSHSSALYSLAVIQFNGSGGSKTDKDLRAGVALCARAAYLGHIDALRELGHCLQDGYGVRQNVSEGRRFLVQANARELAAVMSSTSSPVDSSSKSSSSSCPWLTWHPNQQGGEHHVINLPGGSGCPLLSDFGCNVPPPESHPANKFLVDWFSLRGKKSDDDDSEVVVEDLRLCSHSGCGRPETRRHEFRRCSVCGSVNYCSRACQALDWKLRHKLECTPMEQWPDEEEIDGGGDAADNRLENEDDDAAGNNVNHNEVGIIQS